MSFKFGLQAKSITPSLARKVSLANKECSHHCITGGMYTTKDGRKYPALDWLNPTVWLHHMLISHLVAKEEYCLALNIDGERCHFIPYAYMRSYDDKKSVILQGALFGQTRRGSALFEISLAGGKSYHVKESYYGYNHIKEDVTVLPGEINAKIINRISFLLQQVKC